MKSQTWENNLSFSVSEALGKPYSLVLRSFRKTYLITAISKVF